MMNKLIEQFAKQVTGQFVDLDGVYPTNMSADEYIKFAELIVRECIKIIDESAADPSKYDQDLRIVRMTICVKLGVE